MTTYRRSAGSYALLAEAEAAELPSGPRPDITTFGRTGDAHPAALAETTGEHWAPTPHAVTALAMTAGSATFDKIAMGNAIDARGLVPDQHHANSWRQKVVEVDALELLEVQL